MALSSVLPGATQVAIEATGESARIFKAARDLRRFHRKPAPTSSRQASPRPRQAAGPGWRAPTSRAPRWRASRGNQGDACPRRAAPSLRRRPRGVLHRGQPAAQRRAANAGGTRHPGPAADRSRAHARSTTPRSTAPPNHPAPAPGLRPATPSQKPED